MKQSRELAAIMFVDMAGYSSLAQRNEALAIKLIGGSRSIIRKVLAKHGGLEIKTMGDGFLIVFGSALQASQCAIEIQKVMQRRRWGTVDLRFRIGIHLGDIVRKRRDILGDAVNIASRIVTVAEPGEICISQQVFDQIQGKVKERIVNVGVKDLKHIRRPMSVYRIEVTHTKRASRQTKPGGKRLAVLPLENISANAADEYFSDGMTDEIISTLSQITDFRVIARTSVLRYKGTRIGIAEICRELGVESVVVGSVRKNDDDLRISVQLVDADKEEPIWSQVYDRKFEDVFAIQTDIAKKVSESLKVRIAGADTKGMERKEMGSMEAYTHYLRGRYFLAKRTEGDLGKAAESFRRAIATEPAYAAAYAGLADTLSVLALLEFRAPRDVLPEAMMAAERAIELDDRLGEAYTSRGLVRFQYEWDWERAEADFEKAISLNRSYAPVRHFYADFLKAMGRFDEALEQIRFAQELDPLSLAINTGVGHVLYLSRKYDDAIEQYRKTVELDPAFLQARLWFGRPYLQKGLHDEAISELKEAVRLSSRSTIALSMMAQAFASSGKRTEALELLSELKGRSRSRYVSSYWIAAIYNALGDNDEVFTWFERAVRERSSWLVWINVEPRFDRLRSDDRFKALLRSVKLAR